MKTPYFLALTLCLTLAACSNSKQDMIGQTAETEKIQGIHDMPLLDENGNEIKLEDFKGKMVLLNFWATWCRPCIKEMPNLEAAREILEKEDFIFITISDESWDKINAFRTQRPYGFTWLKLGLPVNSFEIYSLPTTIILNKDGVEVFRHVGIEEWDKAEVLNQLRNL
jgi:thiol-disulfide isomerase/thioredoxin